MGNSAVESVLLEGGPFSRLETRLGLIRPGERRVRRRALLAALIGWVPLAVLAAVEGHALGDTPLESFLLDFATYARFLIAVPVFVIAEAECLPRLAEIARHFSDTGLVASTDQTRYEAVVASTARWWNATGADLVIVVLAYVHVLVGMLWYPLEINTWRTSISEGRLTLSLTGWWLALVSLPLYLMLLYGWVWRVFVWGRFLWKMSRLNLQLNATHPDGAGGLKFIGTSTRPFSFLAFAIAAPPAGAMANLVVFAGQSPLEFKFLILGIVVLVLLLFVGPMLVFVEPLRRARTRALFEYGALAASVGRQFGRKWIEGNPEINDRALQAQDFSATTDLYSIVANVHAMKLIPFDPKKDLATLLIATLSPFLLASLPILPLEVVLKTIVKFLL